MKLVVFVVEYIAYVTQTTLLKEISILLDDDFTLKTNNSSLLESW